MSPERAGQIDAALFVGYLAGFLVGPLEPEELSVTRST